MAMRKLMPLMVLILAILGCNLGRQAATPAPVVPAETSAPDTSAPTEDLAATQAAQQTAEAQSAAETQAAEGAAVTAHAQETADAAPGATAQAIAGKTQTPEARATRLAEAEASATAKAQALFDNQASQFQQGTIQKLYDEGLIDTTEGEYIRMDEFEQAQAQINTYFPYEMGVTAENFVISSDLKWSSASDNANWPTSGCGFVYSYLDLKNLLITWLGLDGFVYTYRATAEGHDAYAFQKWGTPDRTNGEAQAMLVVNDKRITIYVDGRVANTVYDGRYKPGDVALTVMSGTNKGYGTRCTFSNIELFLLK